MAWLLCDSESDALGHRSLVVVVVVVVAMVAIELASSSDGLDGSERSNDGLWKSYTLTSSCIFEDQGVDKDSKGGDWWNEWSVGGITLSGLSAVVGGASL
jgi:hypothetical protein